MSLIELLVALAVMALLIGMGMPAMTDWMQNVRVRSTAEALSSALQLARSEAVRTNGTVIFQVTTSIGNDCAVSTSGSSWVISLCPAEGACGAAPNRNQLRPADGCAGTADPMILAKGNFEGSTGAELNMDNSMICYSGLGRINPAAGNCPADTLDPAASGGTAIIDITSTQGVCVDAGGEMRCLRINIAPGGESRLCDPAVTDANDPRIC
jgi:type IV fimbrial biogenesis protein FimT